MCRVNARSEQGQALAVAVLLLPLLLGMVGLVLDTSLSIPRSE